MAIKDIVCLLDTETDLTTAPVQIATEIASHLNAHLTGVAPLIEPVVPALMVQPVPDQFIADARNRSIQKAKSALERFSEYAQKSDVTLETRLLDITPGGLETFVNNTRLCDLIIVGQDNPDKPEPLRADLIEAALFDSGQPIMVVPYVGTEAFSAKKVMVAWDGSKTAARAIHAAMPILELAEEVQVVLVDGKKLHLPGDPGADLATYLARHGVEVTISSVSSEGKGVAGALLDYVESNKIELVVMGGYGHSRMREFIMGGATREMLTSMSVPCIMAH
ncbi:Nucleotide-binding universal stress protein, UspA family [Cohaesibacter sp. ES.047]|uniref:universal stress protein n=1 Tax=Cohaesibacter sp. ES.047 TaxID=1798205 RepID=UPI000BB743E9|nr:universal stress protein [Cohaesibacter sp. ES.047]SNY92018.1 Nucleotide-binding universal stress protein, UspA family [Cohaesibacter sp. ES.047]